VLYGTANNVANLIILDASSVGFRNLIKVWSKASKKTKKRRSGVWWYIKATKNQRRRNLKKERSAS